MANMISVDQLRSSVKEKRLLNFFSLDVAEREVRVLTGPAGAGKRAFLRALMGFLPYDEGTVRVADILQTPFSRSKIRRKMGYAVKGGGLFPHLTGRQNAFLVAEARGWSRDMFLGRLQDWAKMLNFPWERLSRYPANLRPEECVRIGVIRSLMLDPEILLFDHVLDGLDGVPRRQLLDDLKKLFPQVGKTVVWVTSQLDEAAAIAHRVSVVEKGKVLQTGTFQQLYQSPQTLTVNEFFNAQKPSSSWGNL